MSGLFKQAGYDEDARIGFGERAAVLVVDFQRAFTDPAFPLAQSAHVQSAVNNTARLVRAARAAGAPVIQSYTAHSSERDALHWKVKAVTALFRHGWAGCELDPRTYDPTYDTVFCKAAPSIFFGTAVASFLAKESIDTVFVTGCTTSGCVRASIIDAFSYGLRVMVPAECSGDQEEEAHQANLLDVARRYADVLSLAECIGYFASSPTKNRSTPASDKPSDEPSVVSAVDGAVIQSGPDSVKVALTPRAAALTAKRLAKGARSARAQQVWERGTKPDQ